MSNTTTGIVITIILFLLSAFYSYYAHKPWILYFPLTGFVILIWLVGHCCIQSKYRHDEPSPAFKDEERKRLIEVLRGYSETAPHFVQIQFANIKQQARAKLLKSCFDTAGWQSDFTNVPLETGLQAAVVGYIVGVRVKGANMHLVESISEALVKSGLKNVNREVIQTNISRDSPKWDYIQHKVEITVGHETLATDDN